VLRVGSGVCLIAVAWRAHPRFGLVIAANRDEFRARPTRPAQFWLEYPDLLAGRDLAAGGTWLGFTKHGRFAALTNIRAPARMAAARRSRGELVLARLVDDCPSYPKVDYGGYNLLWGSLQQNELFFDSNRKGQEPVRLASGVFGLSNGALDEPWPKTSALKTRMSDLLSDATLGPETLATGLFEALAARMMFPDEALPDTGIGITRERVLSSAFIDSPDYGTRSSTVVIVEHDGTVMFEERTFDAPGFISHHVFNYRSGKDA
jgi:uncharacterized protein with NRDE domain